MSDWVRKHRKHLAGLVAAIVLVFLLVGFVARKRKTGEASELEVRRGPIVNAVYGIGTVTARQVFNLKVAVNSTIRALDVKEGDQVKAGAPLASLEGAATFRAPFSGTITYLPYNLGETVFPQTPILTLTDLANRYVIVSLEQLAAFEVRRGQSARISFESLRSQSFAGKVRSIYSTSDKQFLVNIDFNELPVEALPGMTGDVAIEISRKDDVTLVPLAGIVNGKSTRLRDGRREPVEVSIGIVDGQWGELMKGDLRPGDRLVVEK